MNAVTLHDHADENLSAIVRDMTSAHSRGLVRSPRARPPQRSSAPTSAGNERGGSTSHTRRRNSPVASGLEQ